MTTTPTHHAFNTTSEQGLRHDTLPMRLYHKAKKLGTWDPQDIDFSQDQRDWEACTPDQQVTLLLLTSLFQAGEESVTLDLLPLMMVIAREGRLEEEMFLTTFLWEEAKHTEFFRRFLDEVTHVKSDLHHYHSASYRKLFYEELPQAMHALLADSSPAAQIRASVTYNMIVEGVLAETGYQAYFNMLERNNIMPGLRQGVGLLKRDESRHLAYGVYLISRLVSADPSLWPAVQQHMNELLVYALGVVRELFTDSEGEGIIVDLPFGLTFQEYFDFATIQYGKRLMTIERAREQSIEEIEQGIEAV